MLADIAGGDEAVAGALGQFLQQGRRIDAFARRVIAEGVLARWLAMHCVAPWLDAQRVVGSERRVRDFRSPVTATCASRSLPISAASMSKWTTRAWGANFASLPVARSSKRAPSTISRSHCLHGLVGGARAVHAQHAEIARPSVGNEPRPCRVETAGMPVAFGEGAHVVDGVGYAHAAADVEQRTLRRADGGFSAAQLRRVQYARRLVWGGARELARATAADLDVLGQVDQHRAGAARGGDVEGFIDHGRDVGGVADDPGVLHDRQGDAQDVDLLERIGAHHAVRRHCR